MFQQERFNWVLMGVIFILSVITLKIDSHPNSKHVLRQKITYFTTPLQAFAQRRAQWCQEIWVKYGQVNTVFEENQTLQQKLVQLEQRLHQRQDLEVENHELQQLLYLKRKKRNFKTIPVSLLTRLPDQNPALIRMIAPSPKDYHYQPTDLKPGLVIMNRNVLVGQITAVQFPYIEVRSLFHARTSIDVILEQTRLRGIASSIESQSKNSPQHPYFPLHLKYLDIERPALEGEFALSTGVDGVYPKGLIIGKVAQAVIPKNGLFQHAQLKPVFRLEESQHALVILENQSASLSPSKKIP